MKKTFLILMTKLLFLLIFCISLLSCGKNETYNPEQKIKRIYEGSYDGTKKLKQEWTWGNDRLVKIDFYGFYNEDIFLRNTEYYTYEDNELVKVKDNEGYFKISYKNKKYERIEYHRERVDSALATWDFTYQNNKISSVIVKYDDIKDFYVSNMEKGGFLSSLIPVSILKNLAKNDFLPSPVVFTYTYKYNGSNIKEIKFTTSEYEDFYSIHSYDSYDKMLNPFYKHIGLDNSILLPYIDMVTSKNNSLKIIEYVMDIPDRITEYSYQYNNEMFPIEVVVQNGYAFGEIESQYKRYYEYE